MGSPWSTCPGRCGSTSRRRGSRTVSSSCPTRRGSAWPSIRRRSSATRSAEAPTQLLREPAELRLLGRAERGDRLDDGGEVAGEDSGDQAAALGGEVDRHVTAIGTAPLAAHQAPTLEVVDDGRDVAAAHQQLVAQDALAQRPEMQERFHDAELRRRQPDLGQSSAQPDAHRGGGPRPLDVPVNPPALRPPPVVSLPPPPPPPPE